MKKIIVMMALLMTTGVAEAAPDYTLEALKQALCRSVGELAKTINEGRRAGETLDANRLALGKSPHTYYLIPTVEMIYRLGPEDHDAYMLGWAACMDNHK